MVYLSLLIYNLALRAYGLGIRFASFTNTKAGQWIAGRKNWKSQLAGLGSSVNPTYWFHCASLGEFEQARPLIEQIKKHQPDCRIVLTFFSPSGYEVRKNYAMADLVMYLPLDTAANASYFIETLQPTRAFFVKYEFWFHYLHQLQQRHIPVVLFSANFRPKQAFFKWYGGLFRQMLQWYSFVFVQNQQSQTLLNSIGINSIIAGDTRFDRVIEIASNRQALPLIAQFKGSHPILIAGSTWPKDETLLTTLIQEEALTNFKYILAPHDIHLNRIKQLMQSLGNKAVRFSELNENNAATATVLVVDSIGQLTSIYAYGDIAYVGGGFDASVHNVLEPAVYRMPVIFGPNHQKSAEAIELLNANAAFCIRNYPDLKMATTALAVAGLGKAKSAGEIARNYVVENSGGTAVILQHLNL